MILRSTNIGRRSKQRGMFGVLNLVLSPSSGDAAPTRPSITGMTAWYDFTEAAQVYKGSGFRSAGNVSASNDPIHNVESYDDGGLYWLSLRQAAADPSAPQYQPAVVNGKGVARFDGGARVISGYKFLKSNTATESNFTQSEMFTDSAKTVIVACYVVDGQPYGLAYGNCPVLGDNSNRFQLGFDTSGSPVAKAYNYDGSDDTASVAISLSTWILLAVTHNGTTLKIRKNKGSWTSQASGATNSMTGVPNIGYSAALVGGTAYFEGDVAHLFTANVVASDADIDLVMDYMAYTIGLTI